jgi:hypothetical protein
LHRAGHTIELATQGAFVPQPGEARARAALDRFTRWMLVLRAHRPTLYPTVPLLFAPVPLLVGLGLAIRTPLVLGCVAVAACARSGLSMALGSRAGVSRWTASYAWLLGEVWLGSAFVRSLWTRRLAWRGQEFRLAAGGQMRDIVRGGLP